MRCVCVGGGVQSNAIGLKLPRKPPAARLPGLAALLTHFVRCGAYVVRRRVAGRPFQSHPRGLTSRMGGTERGRTLSEPGRSKHATRAQRGPGAESAGAFWLLRTVLTAANNETPTVSSSGIPGRPIPRDPSGTGRFPPRSGRCRIRRSSGRPPRGFRRVARSCTATGARRPRRDPRRRLRGAAPRGRPRSTSTRRRGRRRRPSRRRAVVAAVKESLSPDTAASPGGVWLEDPEIEAAVVAIGGL